MLKMERILISVPEMLDREDVIDSLLEFLCENSEVISFGINACQKTWTANVDMFANAVAVGVMLRLSYDEISVTVID